jgi:hypothetical protein
MPGEYPIGMPNPVNALINREKFLAVRVTGPPAAGQWAAEAPKVAWIAIGAVARPG